MTTKIDLDKFLSDLKLEHGSHAPDHAFCVMEAVAYVAGEKWSDAPKCASPVITRFCVAWNDGMNDEDRQMLKPFIPRLAGSKATPAVDRKRSYLALDWYCRVSAPTWLRLAKLEDEAKAIEGCQPVVDAKTAKAATVALQRGAEKARAAWAAAWDAARAAAWAAAGAAAWDAAKAAAGAAAWDAARAAAWDAAGDAAGDAARDAARDAAGDAAGAAAWAAAGDAARDAAGDAAGAAAWDAAKAAAGAAAWDAARDAAGAAAGDAARDALRPTVVALQASALELLDDMLRVGEEVAA